MQNSSQAKNKVYYQVLNRIKSLIEEKKLSEGDKLPSERELAEQLNAARSSVREALRAIELLGLIETKHGGGTYLKTYRPYHTVELLATFVLKESTTIKELFEVKLILEKECIRKVYMDLHSDELTKYKEQLANVEDEHIHFHFFKPFFVKASNELYMKIWQLVDNFTYSSYKYEQDINFYEKLFDLLEQKNFKAIVDHLKSLYVDKIINNYINR